MSKLVNPIQSDRQANYKATFFKLLKSILIIFIVLAFAFVLWVGTRYTLPILMYHYINEQEPRMSRLGVSPASFERQMRFLRERNYNVIPLEKAADLLKYKKKIPPKTVVITFDDGYLDNYTNAYPILKKYHIPATIFIIAHRVNIKLGNDSYLSWEQIKEMAGSGLITIGSHTVTHPNLSETLSEDELRYEIFESKKILEEKLGKKVTLFSYPFGGINFKARQLAIAAGYKAAVATNMPPNCPNDDLYALKRLRISENSRNLFIFWVETAGFYNYIKEHRDDHKR